MEATLCGRRDDRASSGIGRMRAVARARAGRPYPVLRAIKRALIPPIMNPACFAIKRVSTRAPPLVVAFALAGRVDIDLTREPLAIDGDGRPVLLAEVWPGPGEDLCHLAGDWRILQLVRGHRWSLDDLVTAWFAADTTSGAPPARIADLGSSAPCCSCSRGASRRARWRRGAGR
jgi:hypothetical protein